MAKLYIEFIHNYADFTLLNKEHIISYKICPKVGFIGAKISVCCNKVDPSGEKK